MKRPVTSYTPAIPGGPWDPRYSARAIIDAAAARDNARTLSDRIGVPWMAVVKANAYGHDMITMSRIALDSGARWLAVANVHEALTLHDILGAELRHADASEQTGHCADARQSEATESPEQPEAHIFTWLLPPLTVDEAIKEDSPYRAAIRAGIRMSASNTHAIDVIAAAAHAEGQRAYVHVKIDTGMGRAGATESEWSVLCEHARMSENNGHIHVEGIWSHLACADEPTNPATGRALSIFQRAVHEAQRCGLSPTVRHLAATSGGLFHPDTRFTHVRVGIGLYGLTPNPHTATSAELDLTPVMTLQGRITHIKRVPKGTTVSYGGTWVAPSDTWIGIVPLGYADGVPRDLSSAPHTRIPVMVDGMQPTDALVPDMGGRIQDEPWVLVHTQHGHVPYMRVPIIGRICMDQFMVDLGPYGDTAVCEGATVTLFGPELSAPSADDWARWCHTINYEIVTGIGERVPRIITNAGPTLASRAWGDTHPHAARPAPGYQAPLHDDAKEDLT